MSRRTRAIAFGAVALACAGIAAAIANGYGERVAGQFGELRPVVVVGQDLPPDRTIAPRDVGRRLELRQVPVRFVPPDALRAPEEAVGLAPAAAVPAGSYLLASQLAEPRPKEGKRPKLPGGKSPVEIAVSGAGALAVRGRSPEGSRVDVVVTSEPDVGGRGRTYVAAEGVELLALSKGAGSGAPASAPGEWSATLALTRRQALKLIQAQNFARQVNLVPHPR